MLIREYLHFISSQPSDFPEWNSIGPSSESSVFNIHAILKSIVMKSSASALRNQGFFEESDLPRYLHKNKPELLTLLRSTLAFERTIAATLLRNYWDPDVIQQLIHTLEKEKKLYTKIAVTETLASIGPLSSQKNPLKNGIIPYLEISSPEQSVRLKKKTKPD